MFGMLVMSCKFVVVLLYQGTYTCILVSRSGENNLFSLCMLSQAYRKRNRKAKPTSPSPSRAPPQFYLVSRSWNPLVNIQSHKLWWKSSSIEHPRQQMDEINCSTSYVKHQFLQ
ncbi:hypothetical protein EDC01DRAFT_655801 [Geopyxis carbonaria]|nr:hypothetical protein EDC01DRAFT_655801 [Geopyxis carbonaria]